MKIEKGSSYLCIKNVENGLGDNIFREGMRYMSKRDNYIMDNNGNDYYLDTVVNSEYFTHGLVHPMPKDPISPDHYKSYSVETIDMMVAIYGKEKTAIHCELTAFKYRQRLGKKDSLQQDLAKEKWYLDKAKELRNDNSVTNL